MEHGQSTTDEEALFWGMLTCYYTEHMSQEVESDKDELEPLKSVLQNRDLQECVL